MEAGELLGFIGPNGAGKSTTIKMLTGVLHPTSGTARVLGFEPWRERRRMSYHIGTVFGQRPQLLYHLPALDSFHLLGRIYELDTATIRRQIHLLAETFALRELLETPVRKLSLGQRMRCEAAASLLHAPRLLFLDEPSIGLDVVAKQRLRDAVRTMNEEQGVGVLLTSHDAGDIEALCDRVVVLHRGEIIFNDRVAALKRGHLTTKRVHAQYAQPLPADLAVPGAEVVRLERYSVTLRFDVRQTPVEAVVARLAQVGEPADVTLSDPTLEEVIHTIFSGAERDAPPRFAEVRGAGAAGSPEAGAARAEIRGGVPRGAGPQAGVPGGPGGGERDDRPLPLDLRPPVGCRVRLRRALRDRGALAAPDPVVPGDGRSGDPEPGQGGLADRHHGSRRLHRARAEPAVQPAPIPGRRRRGRLRGAHRRELAAGGAVVWLLAGPPPGLGGWPLVAVAVAAGWAIDFCISALIGLSAFVVEDVTAFQWVYHKLVLVLGGVLIPLDFMPGWLRSVSLALPFAYTTYVPARLFVEGEPSRLAGALPAAGCLAGGGGRRPRAGVPGQPVPAHRQWRVTGVRGEIGFLFHLWKANLLVQSGAVLSMD